MVPGWKPDIIIYGCSRPEEETHVYTTSCDGYCAVCPYRYVKETRKVFK